MPYFKNMHEMHPHHIHEEAELQMLDFSGQFVETMGILPRWRDYYLAHDQAPHYQYMKRVMQALQWQRGPDRWIMKSPQHIEQLPALVSAFPDATYVVTHRDPVAIMASFCTMVVYAARIGRNPVDVRAIAGYWVDRIARMLDSCMAHSDCLPRMQTVHVRFDDFMADDMGMVARIYDKAGLALDDKARAEMHDFIDSHPRGKHGRIVYDLKGDFGVDPAVLRERFQFYFDAFPVRAEA